MSSTFWDTKFRDAEHLYGTKPNAFLEHRYRLLPPRGRVLVIGDGEGRNGVWLAQKRFDVTTYDSSEVAIARAKKLAESRGVTIDARYGIAPNIELDEGSFDAVILLYVHTLPELRAPMHQFAAKALRSGGVLLLEGFSEAQLGFGSGGPRDKETLFSNEKLESDFAGLLHIEAISTLETVLEEGIGHQGPASVVRIIATKD